MVIDHIPSLYKPRPTLRECYTEQPLLFNGLHLPSGVGRNHIVHLLLQECGDLDTICPTADALMDAIESWSYGEQPGWEKIHSALVEDYAPLENYRMIEEMTDDTTTRDYGRYSTRTDNLRTQSQQQGQQHRHGFNSPQAVDTVGDTGSGDTTNTGTQRVEDGGRDTETREYTLTRSGNIGVTTSQQMLESEVALRTRVQMCRIIVDAFRRDLCVQVY